MEEDFSNLNIVDTKEETDKKCPQCGGVMDFDPATGNLVEGGVQAQTHQVFANLKAVLEEAGSGLEKIVKTTCFLQDMGDFAAMNEVYASYFEGAFPSRSAVEVAKLPKGGLIEIEAVAYL